MLLQVCVFSQLASTSFDSAFRTHWRALSQHHRTRNVGKLSGRQTVGEESLRVGVHMTQPVKETDMKKLSIVLLAGIATLVAVSEPLLAAQRKHRAVDAYAQGGAVTERVGPQYSGPIRDQALTPAQHIYSPNNGGGPNLPYPDRAYGAPNVD
jgi:hypothetical protein